MDECLMDLERVIDFGELTL